jgi:hypothetical protein
MPVEAASDGTLSPAPLAVKMLASIVEVVEKQDTNWAIVLQVLSTFDEDSEFVVVASDSSRSAAPIGKRRITLRGPLDALPTLRSKLRAGTSFVLGKSTTMAPIVEIDGTLTLRISAQQRPLLGFNIPPGTAVNSSPIVNDVTAVPSPDVTWNQLLRAGLNRGQPDKPKANTTGPITGAIVGIYEHLVDNEGIKTRKFRVTIGGHFSFYASARGPDVHLLPNEYTGT